MTATSNLAGDRVCSSQEYPIIKRERSQMSFVIRCMDCGYSAPFNPSSMHCPQCNSQWREAEYDLADVAKTFPSELSRRPFDLWRYIELLPINKPNPTLR